MKNEDVNLKIFTLFLPVPVKYFLHEKTHFTLGHAKKNLFYNLLMKTLKGQYSSKTKATSQDIYTIQYIRFWGYQLWNEKGEIWEMVCTVPKIIRISASLSQLEQMQQ